jgi:DNA polymerase-3 subunit delta'
MLGGLLTRGHPAAVEAVRQMIVRDSAPHALLISGPGGTGKTTLAFDLAAGLLCLDTEPAARPCRDCMACRKVAHATHPDVHVIASEGAGDQVRLAHVQALVAELALMPMEGRQRVAIVIGAHRLNPDAQNALLKTLEEPPGAATIVLCADDTATILPTVVSRAARLRLGSVPRQMIADLLVEHELADPARAATIAAASDGSPGRAVSLASQPEALLAHASLARQLIDLVSADRRARLASIGRLLADGLVAEGADSRRPQPAERRRAAQRVIAAWREVGRDLLLMASGDRAQVRMLDLLEDLDAVTPAVERGQLVAFLDRLDRMSAAIEAYANPELALDGLVLSWPGLRAPRHE